MVRKKKKGTGKKIGTAWENDVAKLFSRVFELSFIRVPNSGAYVGGQNVERLSKLTLEQIMLMKGDIIPPSELPNLIIECKKRKEFKIHQLLDHSLEMNTWIDQVEIDYNACGKRGTWLIVFKINYIGYYVCWPSCISADIHEELLHPDDIKDNYLEYRYNDKVYCIEKFTDKWLDRRKKVLLKYCSGDQQGVS